MLVSAPHHDREVFAAIASLSSLLALAWLLLFGIAYVAFWLRFPEIEGWPLP